MALKLGYKQRSRSPEYHPQNENTKTKKRSYKMTLKEKYEDERRSWCESGTVGGGQS